MAWPDEHIELLRELAAQKMRASEIAARIGGVTKNAVIGQAKRNGIPLLYLQPGQVKPSRRNNLTKLIWNGKPPKVLRARKPPSFPKTAPIRTDPLRIGLMDLRPHHCRWTLDERGTDGLMLYCGLPEHDRSYCRHHYDIAHSAPSNVTEQDRERRRLHAIKNTFSQAVILATP